MDAVQLDDHEFQSDKMTRIYASYNDKNWRVCVRYVCACERACVYM